MGNESEKRRKIKRNKHDIPHIYITTLIKTMYSLTI